MSSSQRTFGDLLCRLKCVCYTWSSVFCSETFVDTDYILAVASHYGDDIMGAIASQITSLAIVYSTVYSDADQRKHQSSASLAFVWGIHRGRPVKSPHKWPVTRKMFPFDDVIMVVWSWNTLDSICSIYSKVCILSCCSVYCWGNMDMITHYRVNMPNNLGFLHWQWNNRKM